MLLSLKNNSSASLSRAGFRFLNDDYDITAWSVTGLATRLLRF